MRVSHWTDFSPATSQIDNFYGGVKGTPELAYDEFNTRGRMFASVAYRLAVSPDHNNYHHFLGMYTSLQGVAFENACVKKNVRTGFHHICVNFSIPYDNAFVRTDNQSEAEYRERSYKSTFMYAGEIGANTTIGAAANYGINSTWAGNTVGQDNIDSSGRLQDLFVLRPTLVNSANKDDFIQLWDAGAYANNGGQGGQQMFFTGIPMAHPRFALNSYTSNPYGRVGVVSTTWSSIPGTVSLSVPDKFEIDFATATISLTNGAGNTVMTFAQPSSGNLKAAASTSGFPTDAQVTNNASVTVAHTSGTLYMKFRFQGGPVDVDDNVTITLTNNSEVQTFFVNCFCGVLQP